MTYAGESKLGRLCADAENVESRGVIATPVATEIGHAKSFEQGG